MVENLDPSQPSSPPLFSINDAYNWKSPKSYLKSRNPEFELSP